jgi:hypothetical protein
VGGDRDQIANERAPSTVGSTATRPATASS